MIVNADLRLRESERDEARDHPPERSTLVRVAVSFRVTNFGILTAAISGDNGA